MFFLDSPEDSRVRPLVVDGPRAPLRTWRSWVTIAWVMADAFVYSKSIYGSILFDFQLEERQKEWEREYVVMAWREV